MVYTTHTLTHIHTGTHKHTFSSTGLLADRFVKVAHPYAYKHTLSVHAHVTRQGVDKHTYVFSPQLNPIIKTQNKQ